MLLATETKLLHLNTEGLISETKLLQLNTKGLI